jgi:iron complex outermembrane receptor protein
MNFTRFGSRKLTLVSSSIALVLSSAAFAAQGTEAAVPDDASLEPVIVTGTRRAERTAVESNVPVDVVTQADLQSTFTSDLNNKLQALVPSYNVRRLPLNDGAMFVRPATLRALSPDHTLVLINGKRFHRSAFIDVTSRGAQGEDVSLIPQSAVKRIEVLRDGASAQYGSDAIAGVVNFILEDKPGTNGYLQFGEYSAGDGANVQASVQSGIPLADRGIVNLTLEYANSDATSRSVQRPQADALIALGEPYASSVTQPYVQRFGQPDLESLKVFLNSSFELGDSTKAYVFGNYADISGVNDFNWRAPAAAAGAAKSSAYNRSVFQNGPNAIYPDWDLRSVFPGGFTPRFGSEGHDYSAVLGVKGDWTENLNWDLSASRGRNRIDYSLSETINASLGPLSPTSFDAGSREQTETNVNLDFVYGWQTALAAPVNVGFGFEYRREQFEIDAGEEASWIVGPLRDLAPASNGFPGASPVSAGKWSTENTAAYADVDVDFTERWNVDVAGRVENYSTFGVTTNGKISSRFRLTEALSLRGAASTGFRAPTPGQQNLTNINQNPNAQTNVVLTNGIFPSTSPGAEYFGGRELQPEKSTNFSAGLVYAPSSQLSATLDAYQIEISDRIGISQTFTVTPADRLALIAAGVPNASELNTVRYFANGFDTRTRGVDLVGSFHHAAGPGRLGLTAAFNYNDTKITQADPTVISPVVVLQVERALPRVTGILSTDYEWNKLKLFARARHYGEWIWAADASNANLNQPVGSETFIDLFGTYALTKDVDITVGAENLLDNYTELTQFNQALGRKYPGQVPYENDGRQAYVRVGIRF